MVQSEAQLEENLIKRLGGLGYDRVVISDEAVEFWLFILSASIELAFSF